MGKFWLQVLPGVAAGLVVAAILSVLKWVWSRKHQVRALARRLRAGISRGESPSGIKIAGASLGPTIAGVAVLFAGVGCAAAFDNALALPPGVIGFLVLAGAGWFRELAEVERRGDRIVSKVVGNRPYLLIIPKRDAAA